MRVLTINSHESYISNLACIDEIELTIIDQMTGRYTEKWDERIRKIPENAKLVTMSEAIKSKWSFDVFIGHNLTDIRDSKPFKLPSVMIIHSTLDGLLLTQSPSYSRDEIHKILQAYVNLTNVLPVAVSTLKAKSWGITDCPIIPFYIDGNIFQGYKGTIAAGLRVANQLVEKGAILEIDMFGALIEGENFNLIGHNPVLGISSAANQEELVEAYQSHRYYIHTAAPNMEDGYNTASLEAMAVGMPIICNNHSSAPVEDGVHGFKSDDIDYLRTKIKLLDEDQELARQLGANGRQYVLEHHSLDTFKTLWLDVLEQAVETARGDNLTR